MTRNLKGKPARPKQKTVGSRTGKPKPRAKSEERMNWQGRELLVSYEADWINREFDAAHLEIQVQSPERAVLPITDTGYRSHFLARRVVEQAGGPVAYVRAWLDDAAKAPAWKRQQQRSRQLCLF